MDNTLTKVYNAQRNDGNMRILVVLWAYKMTCKMLTGQTPFRLVCVIEVMIPMEYIVHSLRIVAFIRMTDRRALEERLTLLIVLEEDRFLAGFHQQVQKEHEKA